MVKSLKKLPGNILIINDPKKREFLPSSAPPPAGFALYTSRQFEKIISYLSGVLRREDRWMVRQPDGATKERGIKFHGAVRASRG
jgi:hypothetical protein